MHMHIPLNAHKLVDFISPASVIKHDTNHCENRRRFLGQAIPWWERLTRPTIEPGIGIWAVSRWSILEISGDFDGKISEVNGGSC